MSWCIRIPAFGVTLFIVLKLYDISCNYKKYFFNIAFAAGFIFLKKY